MKNIDIIERHLLSNDTYALEKITFSKPGLNGSVHNQQNEIYFRPDAVAILLVDHLAQEFVLTKQVRLPVYLKEGGNGELLETCAGLIENDETPEVAARREIAEETGYETFDLNYLGGIYTSAGGITEYLHLFTAYVTEARKLGAGGGAEGEGEDISLVRISFEKANQMLDDYSINDAKTRILLQHFFLKLARK